MKTTNVTIIQASDGMWLTQAQYVEQRSFSKSVINPQDGAWVEWSEEQKSQYEEEHQEVEEPIQDEELA